ncbi:MAG: GIY-YIG nuclease family protein [Proteobacteria bacterium]|nr:GIY-YIG nuclease family protein [Pseudomonadota bacterium]
MYCYCIHSKINNKNYIGITINEPILRFKKHISSAKCGSNLHFHQAIRKYGEFNFEIKSIDYTNQCINWEELCEIERHWIHKLDTYNNGYNSTTGGEYCLGEQLEKEVFQYDINGNFIKKFKSIKDAAKITKSQPTGISNVCRGIDKSCNRFIWKYKYEENPKYKNLNFKEVHQYSLDGNYVRSFDSITEASKSIKIERGNISSTVSGHQKSAAGFLWTFNRCNKIQKYNPSTNYNYSLVKQIDKITKKVIRIFESITEAKKETKINNISTCCRGIQKTAGGYIWQYC